MSWVKSNVLDFGTGNVGACRMARYSWVRKTGRQRNGLLENVGVWDLWLRRRPFSRCFCTMPVLEVEDAAW